MNIQKFDYHVDLLKVILWQYNDAEKLQKILEQKQNWYNKNQSEFWSSWYKDVFNLDTANDFGLSVWAIILNMPLVADAGASEKDSPAFGFGEYNENFENGNFFTTSTTSVRLTTQQKRLVLKLRYYQLISNGTVPEINRFLKSLFGDAWVLDTYDMSYAIFVINTEISSELQFILENYDLLPRPAGVGTKIIYNREDLFGFGEDYQNFNNGVLADINSYKV